jgi:hypothetical protein
MQTNHMVGLKKSRPSKEGRTCESLAFSVCSLGQRGEDLREFRVCLGSIRF